MKNIVSFNESEIESMYQNLISKLEGATTIQDKCRIYSQIKGLRYASKNPSIVIKGLKPGYYDEYLKKREKEIVDYFIGLDDLTYELCYYWTMNLQLLLEDYSKGEKTQKFDKASFLSDLERFFDTNFQLDKKPHNLLQNAMANGDLQISQSPFRSSSAIFYFQDLQKALMKIVYSGPLNEHVLIAAIHELGHYYVENIFNRKQNQEERVEKSILTEAIPNYFEFEANAFYNQIDSRKMISKLLEQYRETKVIDLRNYYSSCIAYDSPFYIEYNMYLDIISSMYGDIISLILSEIKKEDISRFQEAFNILSSNIYSKDPFAILKQIGITTDTLVETAKNARHLILSRK